MTAFPLVQVEAAWASDPLDTSPIYTELLSSDGVTSRLNDAVISRAIGRAGTFVGTFDNNDDALNAWNTASPYYGNLLTEQQASLESAGTVGWVAGTNCGISRTTARALHGVASLLMSSAAAGTMSATTETTRVVVIAGQTYTAMAHFSRNAPQRNVRTSIRWFDISTLLSTSTGANVLEDAGSGYIHTEVTAVAPAGANRADILVEVLSTGAASEEHYVDQIGFFGGGSTGARTWISPAIPGMVPMKKMRSSAWWNRLTEQQASLEAAGTAGWVAGTNCTIARSALRGLDGTASLLMTAAAAGDMSATTETTRNVVSEGQPYVGMAHFSRNGPERSVRVSIRWFNISTLLSTTVGTTVAEPASSAYVHAEVHGTAPTGANRADVLVEVLSPAAGESHFVDEIGFFGGPLPANSEWSRGGPYYLSTKFIEEFGAEWENINYGDVAIRAVDAFKILTLVKPGATDYYDAQVASTPNALYRLGETGRSSVVNGLITAEDSTANNYDGLYKGSPSSFEVNGAVPSEANTAVDFGERAGWVEIPMAACPSGTGNWTVEAWVYPRSFAQNSPFDRIWHALNVGSQIVELVIQLDGKLRFEATASGNGGTLYSSVALNLYEWNHVVAVKSGTTGPANWKLYINNVDVSTSATISGTGNVSITANTSLIAGDDASGVQRAALDGMVDEFAIYYSALSAANVDTHFDAAYGLTTDVLTGSRIGSLLDLIDWPAADRTLDAGQFQMQQITEPIHDTPPLAYMLTLVESEGWPAALFGSGDGKVVFQDRAHATPSSSATFSDGSSTLYYEAGPGPKRSDDGLWTRIMLQADGGQPQRAEDATAAARYVGRTLTRTGLKNASDANVATMASSELTRWKAPMDRMDRLVIHPIDEPGSMWPQVLGRELNDVITVTRTDFPGGGSSFTGTFRIVGIEHRFSAQDWFTTWTLEPT